MNLPNFLIIGAMKAGTTTLYRDLLTNSAVFMPKRKEPHNLCDDAVLTEAGKRAYAEYFASAAPDQMCGEASTGYTKLPVKRGVPERAMKLLGRDLKLIYVMREPVSRIISHHYHAYSSGTVGADINEAVRKLPDLLDFTRYAMQLQPWIELFGRDHVHVLVFERFVADRRATATRICNFLEIEPRPELIATDKAYNRSDNKPLQNRLWVSIARNDTYRRLLRPLLPLSMKDHFRAIAFPKAPPRPAPPTEETVQWIRDALADDQRLLQSILGESGPIWPEQSGDQHHQGSRISA